MPVGSSPHDVSALTYSGGHKLYVPVEKLDVLSRYGCESEGVALDRLGGEAWQRRKSRLKERIREIAGELIAVAAARALRPGEVAEPEAPRYATCVAPFPFPAPDDQDRPIATAPDHTGAGKPMDPERITVGYGQERRVWEKSG